MIAASGTNTGKKRRDNQDSYVIRPIGASSYVAVVCDGMGGAAGGKTASLAASESFTEYISEHFIDGGNDEFFYCLLNEAVSYANGIVYDLSKAESRLKGMGTTLVAVLVTDTKVYAVNVGDSRLYEIRDGEIGQITKDHTYVRYLLDIGEITVEEAKTHPKRHMITRAVGVDEDVKADIFFFERKGQKLLLCSDGLYGMVEDAVIRDAVAEAEDFSALDSAVGGMISLANKNGGTDNITAVAIIL